MIFHPLHCNKTVLVGKGQCLEPLSGPSRLRGRIEFSSCRLTRLIILGSQGILYSRCQDTFFTCDFTVICHLNQLMAGTWSCLTGSQRQHKSKAQTSQTSNLQLKSKSCILPTLVGWVFIAPLCVKPGSNTY